MQNNVAPDIEVKTAAGLPPPLPIYIAEKIAADIESNKLKPGTKLSEEMLASKYGVSRAPVREALRILDLEELVQIEPRRGVRVRRFAPREISEMFEMRAVLYALGVELFTRRASEDELNELLSLRPTLRELADDPSTTAERFAEASQRSSSFILAHCGNQRVKETMRKMTRQSFRHFAILANGRPERRQETASLGEQMVAAIQRRDPHGASKIAREIVDRNHAEVMRRVAAGES